MQGSWYGGGVELSEDGHIQMAAGERKLIIGGSNTEYQLMFHEELTMNR